MTTNLPANPYVGPRAFTEREANRFFGRQREARDLLARVVSERLLLFYAQSGAGKSSLLHTRLIPGLRDHEGFQVLPVGRVSGALPAGAETVDNIYLFNLLASLEQSGGASAALAARLAHVSLPDFLARLAGERTTDADGNSARRWVFRPDAPAAPPLPAGSGPRFALIIDQFEEIISTHPERWAERADFFRQLDAALRADPNLWIVLTLREDYVASLDPYAALVTNKLQARYRMERMDVAAALEAVRRPAALGGRPFAPGVAEALVDDLRQIRLTGQAGAIPGQYVEPVQLQVVCYQLWARLHEERNLVSGRNQVSQEDLAAAGDVDRALEEFYAATLAAVTADPAVAAAGVSERSLRTWFDKELITPSGIRSIVLRNERSGRTGSLPNAAVDALSQRFLLRTELRGGGAWVELVHDRFVEPIRASNEAWFAEHLSTLQRAAALWQDSGRASGLLLADAALDGAVAWASTHVLLPYEQEFLDASLQLRAAAERERKLRKRISILAIAASIGLIVAIMALIFAGIRTKEVEAAKQDAEFQTRRTKASELAAEAQIEMAKDIPDPVLALLLAKEAISATLTDDGYVHEKASKALLDAIESAPPWVMNWPLAVPGESVNSAVFSPDGTRILTAGCDEYDDEANCLRGTARVWDRDTARLLFTLDGHGCGSEWPYCGVMSASYSRDGSHIVTVGADGQAIVWDADSGREAKRFGEESVRIISAGLSADGAQIVTATVGCALTDFDCDYTIDGRVISTGQILYSLHPEYDVMFVSSSPNNMSVSYSPDDAQILTVGSNGTAQVWDVASRSAVLTLGNEDQPLYAGAFSPDGDRIVAAWCDEPQDESPCQSKVARVWRATDGTLLTTLRGHGAFISAASFSPDGSQILTVSKDGTARIWNAMTGAMILMLNNPAVAQMQVAAYSPGGEQIITASLIGPVQIWDAAKPKVLPAIKADKDQILSIAVSSDGSKILTTSLYGGFPKLRDFQTGTLLWEVESGWSMGSATVSPKNDLIVTTSPGNFEPGSYGTVSFLDLASGVELRKMQHPSCAEDGACGEGSVAFSSDGSLVITSRYDDYARVFRAADGVEVLALGPHAGFVTSARFSRNGKYIVTADGQANVTVWEADTGEPIHNFIGGHLASFNPEGDHIVTGSYMSGTLAVWDAFSGDSIWSFDGHDSSVNSVEYGPTGKVIVSTGGDNTAKLWDAATGHLLFTYTGHGCGPDGDCDVSAATFTPDGKSIVTGGYDGTVRIWPATVDALLDLADSLIWRDPPLLTPEERRRYGLE